MMPKKSLVIALATLVAGCGTASGNGGNGWFAGLGFSSTQRSTGSDNSASARNARVAVPEVTRRSPCGAGMVSVDGRFCIDAFEASLVDVLPNGEERLHSPFQPVDHLLVRAVSRKGVYPQGYINALDAKAACKQSGKRLCRAKEWVQACMGPAHQAWGYGAEREPSRCNDSGRSPMSAMVTAFGANAWSAKNMNDPALNQMENTLAKTGAHEGCTNGYGVRDMVGNLHEWVDDAEGTFAGGYYQDVTLNGQGCGYKTTAHDVSYHDYSTGFRCCADVTPAQ